MNMPLRHGPAGFWMPKLKNRQKLRRAAVKAQKGKCIYCGCLFSDHNRPTLEHITPRCKGGKDTFENTCASCFDCNSARGASNHYAFMRHRQQPVIQ